MAILCQSLFLAATEVSQTDVQRARNQLKSTVLLQLESAAVFAEQLARQRADPRQNVSSLVELCDKIGE